MITQHFPVTCGKLYWPTLRQICPSSLAVLQKHTASQCSPRPPPTREPCTLRNILWLPYFESLILLDHDPLWHYSPTCICPFQKLSLPLRSSILLVSSTKPFCHIPPPKSRDQCCPSELPQWRSLSISRFFVGISGAMDHVVLSNYSMDISLGLKISILSMK